MKSSRSTRSIFLVTVFCLSGLYTLVRYFTVMLFELNKCKQDICPWPSSDTELPFQRTFLGAELTMHRRKHYTLMQYCYTVQKDFVYATQRKQCSCKIIRDISNIPCNLSIFWSTYRLKIARISDPSEVTEKVHFGSEKNTCTHLEYRMCQCCQCHIHKIMSLKSCQHS